MSLSRIKYPSTGSCLFSIPFEFLAKAHIEVYLDGVQTSAYDWVGDKAISLTSVPPSGTIVEIRRNTPKTARLVNFQDGSMLGEKDLDTDSNQIFFVAQEGIDDSGETLKAVASGDYDALSKKIINLADPVGPYDAVNKRTLSYEYPAVVSVGEHLADIQAIAGDLTSAGLSIQDLGSIASPLDGAPTGSGLISQVAAVSSDIHSVGSNMASVTFLAANMQAVLTAVAAYNGIVADGSITGQKLAASIDLGALP